MKGKLLFVLIAAALLLSAAAMAETPPIVDLSYIPAPYDGKVIEVLPVDIEMLWIHVNWDCHVEYLSFHPHASNSSGFAEMLQYEIRPTDQLIPSQWYPFGTVMVTGVPSTLITISVDVNGVESNTITKHITPEPSALLALGTGFLGIGGLLLRRRR